MNRRSAGGTGPRSTSAGRAVALDSGVGALVVKVGRYRLHHGGLAVVRTLGRAGVPVYAVQEDRFTPTARSRYLTGGFVWPASWPAGAPDRFVDGLRAIGRQLRSPCVLVPTDDKAAILLNDHTAELPELFRLPAARPGLYRAAVDKRDWAGLAARAGLPAPDGTPLSCPVPTAALADVRLPAVVKRIEPALLADGSRSFSTLLVRSPDQLRAALQDRTTGPYDVLVQELVTGDDWLYHGYCDPTSRALVSFTGRKLRSRPPHAGETAFARAESNDDLRGRVEQFLQMMSYVGPVSMDLRYDRRADTYRLLDVNPRTGACFRMFVNTYGVDVVRALHLDLSGCEVPHAPQVDGRTYVVENYDLSARHGYGAAGGSGVGSSVRRAATAERAWIQRDDLLPAAAAFRQVLTGPGRAASSSRTATEPRYFPGRGRR